MIIPCERQFVTVWVSRLSRAFWPICKSKSDISACFFHLPLVCVWQWSWESCIPEVHFPQNSFLSNPSGFRIFALNLMGGVAWLDECHSKWWFIKVRWKDNRWIYENEWRYNLICRHSNEIKPYTYIDTYIKYPPPK